MKANSQSVDHWHDNLTGILTAVALLLVIAALTFWQTRNSAAVLPSPPFTCSECVFLTEGITVSYFDPQIGQLITVTCPSGQVMTATILTGQPVTIVLQLRNMTDQAVVIPEFGAGVRGPNAHVLGWGAPNRDFPHTMFIALQSGEIFTYSQTRAFAIAGDYFVEPVRLNASKWGGVPPYTRVWLNVENAIVGK